MNRDNRPWAPTPAPELDWTEGSEPYSRQFEDLYYSREDGMAESQHVFLAGNKLPQRWQKWQPDDFRIAETGFGTGLNFLLSWQAWREQPQPKPRLHYLSVEKFPLSREQMARALAPWGPLAPLVQKLLNAWPGRLAGQHRLVFEEGQVVLDLWWEDATQAFGDLARHGPLVDAWYLDGFAPARNESMWQQTLFQSMAVLSRPAATVATFTAAGHVRRGLATAGFQVNKVPGFGRKRESLAGVIDAAPVPPESTFTPWDLPATANVRPASALIIGAGLAGCSLARALALRGIDVQLLDRGELAGEASGNEQGILYTRLSRRHSTLTDFALLSFTHAAALYRRLFADGLLSEDSDGSLCGSFHQHNDEEELALLKQSLEGLEDLAQVLSPIEAKAKLGVEPAMGGYWYPASGWLRPPAVCRAMVKSHRITLRENCGQLQLTPAANGWTAVDNQGQTIASADIAILCTGAGSMELAITKHLPLQSIRGQTSYIPATSQTSALRAALCHKGYISPARDDIHCIGASFKLRDSSTQLRPEEHRENLDKLTAALPQWSESLDTQNPETLQGRVGFRCASPDYLPVAGPAPQVENFLQTYGPLRKNAKQLIRQKGDYVPGLYINTAHGSRGLSSAPLCAEMLASQICGEPPPLSSELSRALSPARFLVRDLGRNRI